MCKRTNLVRSDRITVYLKLDRMTVNLYCESLSSMSRRLNGPCALEHSIFARPARAASASAGGVGSFDPIPRLGARLADLAAQRPHRVGDATLLGAAPVDPDREAFGLGRDFGAACVLAGASELRPEDFAGYFDECRPAGPGIDRGVHWACEQPGLGLGDTLSALSSPSGSSLVIPEICRFVRALSSYALSRLSPLLTSLARTFLALSPCPSAVFRPVLPALLPVSPSSLSVVSFSVRVLVPPHSSTPLFPFSP